MTKNALFRFAQAALCTLLFALPAAGIMRIYAAHPGQGASAFTRDGLAAKLLPVVPVLIAMIAVNTAARASGLRPVDAGRPVRDAGVARDLIASRASLSGEMLRERSYQKRMRFFAITAFAVCMLPVVLFLTDAANYDIMDFEAVHAALLARLVPCAIVGFGLLSTGFILIDRSRRREAELGKPRLSVARREDPIAPYMGVRQKRGVFFARLVLSAAALAMVIAGIANGGMKDVFFKAIRICAECVGLG